MTCPSSPAACPLGKARGALPDDGEERLFLMLMRFVGAGYETEDAACWEEAHRCAEVARGSLGGAFLVARAAHVVRTLRRQHPDFRFLPPVCRCLSAEEAGLMGRLRLAEFGDGEAPALQTLDGSTEPRVGPAQADSFALR